MLRNKTAASIPVLLSSQGMRMICISNFVWKLGIIFYADNLFVWTASITLLSRVFDAINLEWKEEISPVIQNWLGSRGWEFNFSPWTLRIQLTTKSQCTFRSEAHDPATPSPMSYQQVILELLQMCPSLFRQTIAISYSHLISWTRSSNAPHASWPQQMYGFHRICKRIFAPSSKVSADVAHRTFAGAQQAAASSRPSHRSQTQKQAATGPPTLRRSISRNSHRKLSCARWVSARAPAPTLHQPAESAAPAPLSPDPAEKSQITNC